MKLRKTATRSNHTVQRLCCRSQFFGGTGLSYRTSLFGCFDPKVVAMLAEIFMVRLEVAARGLKETVPSSTSRFIPFAPNSQFTFKPSSDGLPEALREEPTVQKVQ
jgi:hypothetical protein